ncbi:MAG: DUF58 domain-containing protein [Oligoflexia bacterium]|nr:DUF58 domain-containing protein [Oligoflexia bacterium]MBF0366851.1 DUF58 domain-containing protein [Oligoflexia bacterium]
MEQRQQLLDKDLISKIKGIQFRARHLVDDAFAGEYRSTFRGRGMEFDEIREYILGDDVRSIDWNVTARMGHPFVKLFKDERELTVVFVVDVSASSNFGTVTRFKNEIAAEIAALLAYMALRNNDKVGLVVFSDRVEHYLPPKKGRGHVWTVIRDILTYPHQTEAKKTDLNAPLQFLNRVLKRRAITFLISDFLGAGFEQQLRVTSHRHDLIALSISDPREMELPNIGYIELEDAETGEALLVDTSDYLFSQDFKGRSTKQLKQQKDFFRANGIDLIQVNTAESYINPLIQFFKMRAFKS